MSYVLLCLRMMVLCVLVSVRLFKCVFQDLIMKNIDEKGRHSGAHLLIPEAWGVEGSNLHEFEASLMYVRA